VFFASFIVSLLNFTENWTIKRQEQVQVDEEVAEQL
jgi:hypothetical protein